MNAPQIWDRVSGNRRVFVIAEIGKNFIQTEKERPVEEYLDNAKALVRAAHESGADAVKFQNFKAEEVTTASAGMAAYQKRNTGTSESQIDMIRKLELKDRDFRALSAHCKKRGIMFLSAPHSGFGSVDLLVSLKAPAFKFGSADLNNLPVLAAKAHTIE